MTERMEQRLWLTLALACSAWLLYLLSPILLPFVVGGFLAYMGDPLADRLEDRGVSRTGSVVIVFLVISVVSLAVLLLLLPMLQGQVKALIGRVPAYFDWAQTVLLPWVSEVSGVVAEEGDLQPLRDWLVENVQSAGGIVANVARTLSRSGLGLLTLLGNLLLIPVVTFYLLRDWDVLVARIRELLPRGNEATITRLAQQSDEVLGAFLRGQVIVMITLGSIYSVGLWFLGLELALLIGITAGVVSFVPYLGLVFGVAAAGLSMFMQTQDWIDVLQVLALFGFAQLIEGAILTPVLVGDRIGLHPIAVIFAVLAGGQLFGFVGVLLALPVAAVLAVILRHLHELYLQSNVYRAGSSNE